MRHATRENISGVMYRCRECGQNLGDPEQARDFAKWAIDVRAHMVLYHAAVPSIGKTLNDLVAAFFIWTTPTGQECATTISK